MAVAIEIALKRVFNDLLKCLKLVLDQTILAARFTKQLNRLEKTLQSIKFNESWRYSKVLDRPQKEITEFIVYMNKGKELVLKCSRVNDLNTNQKYFHLYKLIRLNNELLRFFKVEMEVKMMITSMRSLSGVSDLAYKMDQLLFIEGKPLFIEQLAQPTDEAFDSICYDLTAPKGDDLTLSDAFTGDIESPNMLPGSLTELRFDGCYDLKELPSGICSLVNLRALSITNCHELDGLPKALGNLLHLENLSLRCCTKLQELPESIGSLRNLISIDISDCLSISVLPEEIGELSCLRVLKMSGCRGLQELPLPLSNLCQLEDVTCDEETSYLWMNFGSDLYDLKVNVVEDNIIESFMKIIRFLETRGGLRSIKHMLVDVQFEKAIEELKFRHEDHIVCYGKGNERRLTVVMKRLSKSSSLGMKVTLFAMAKGMSIMPPMMTTRSAGRPAAASGGEGTGGQAGRGGVRTRGYSGDQGDGRIDGQGDQLQNLLPAIVAQVGDQGRCQGNGRNQNGDAVNVNIQGDVSRGCTYKEFLACNPKEYNGKGGDIVYTRWIEKMESVQDMSGCRDSQKVKYNDGSFVGKALTWWNSQIYTRGWEVVNHAMVGVGHVAYTDRFHELARLVPHLATPEGKRIERYVYGLVLQIRGIVAATEPKIIQKTVQIAGTLTDEALRNKSIKKNPEKRGNRREPSKDRNGREDNKRTRTRNVFATTINPVRRENTGVVPNCTTYNTHHPPEAPCHACFNYNRPGHFAKDCRVVPRNGNPINTRNLIVRACYECGSTDHIKSACPRLNQAQRPGETIRTKSWLLMGFRVVKTKGTRQEVGHSCWEQRRLTRLVGQTSCMGTFILNDPLCHYSNLTSGFPNYSFVSTIVFIIICLDIEPSELGFSYEIEIASGQLVEIDNVIKGYKLEIEGHVFDINLIPFGSRSFDVIIGMDWLSDHKAEIICHEKVVRIPLLDGKSIFSLCYLFRNPFSSTTIGDENPIRTLGDYSKPSHEGYRNTIELRRNQRCGKLRNKNIDESWEIIENCALYDHEGWDETKEFVKLVKAISIPQGISKTPDRRLLELEDQINFLLKGSRPTPTSSSAHTPQAYVNAVHPNTRPQNQNKPLKLNTFAFRERIDPESRSVKWGTNKFRWTNVVNYCSGPDTTNNVGAMLMLGRGLKIVSTLTHPIPPPLQSPETSPELLQHDTCMEEMDDPNITMEEYILLEEEKARRRGKVYNWETATYGKIWYDEDVHYLGTFEKEFPVIVYNDALTSKPEISSRPTDLTERKDDYW
ncbi:reverse transcriptase domain-containing protein [Tanacetum coccineum]